MAPRSVEDGWYGRGAPPIIAQHGSMGDISVTQEQVHKSLSISQEDISKNSPHGTHRHAHKGAAPLLVADPKLKVDASVLIKWGKGKDAEYRRGLLVYRVISLKRLIAEYLGGQKDSLGLDHARMDVGMGDLDTENRPKNSLRAMGLLGVAAEEYNCLMRDLQDLMLPDFEINLRRKIETATRMQQTYRCFSTN
jgi:hypothetical protein